MWSPNMQLSILESRWRPKRNVISSQIYFGRKDSCPNPQRNSVEVWTTVFLPTPCNSITKLAAYVCLLFRWGENQSAEGPFFMNYWKRQLPKGPFLFNYWKRQLSEPLHSSVEGLDNCLFAQLKSVEKTTVFLENCNRRKDSRQFGRRKSPVQIFCAKYRNDIPQIREAVV